MTLLVLNNWIQHAKCYGELLHFQERQLCQTCFCLPSEKGYSKRKEFDP